MPAPIPDPSVLLLYPADRAAFQYTQPGDPILVPYITPFVIYLDEAATTPATIYEPVGGGIIPNSTVYTEETGLLAEFLVADVTQVWGVAQVNGQAVTPYRLDAAFGPRIDALAASGPGGAGNAILSGYGAPGGLLGTNGDWYIDKAATALYGPKTAGIWGPATSLVGPPGPPGPPGSGGGGSSYTHTQYGSAQIWDIVHPLGYVPAVTIVDTGGTEIKGDTHVISNNHLQVEFAFAFPGTAFLS